MMATPNKAGAGSKVTHPLPLASTLHDLALFRASDLDFASLLPASQKTDTSDDADVEQSVQRSREFSQEARGALKLLHSDAVEREGTRVDQVREKLEDVVKGLDGTGTDE